MKKPKKRKFKKKRRLAGPPPSQKAKRTHAWLNVLPDDLWVKVRRGKTIWEALQNQDVDLGGDCGGLGKCGKCKIKVISSIRPPTAEEKELLSEEQIKDGIRLACRIPITKDLVIHIGDTGLGMDFFQILKTGPQPIVQLDPLVDKRPVTLPQVHDHEGLSDLDRIRTAMQEDGLVASLHCLRSLPAALQRTAGRGAAVLHDNCLLAWEDRGKIGRRYGLVFDLGTSTLVGKLVSLLDGQEVAVISLLNGQSRYGSDVISRLQYVQDHADGLSRLHQILIRDLRRIVKRLLNAAELSPEDIHIAVVAGNTTMQHFLLNVNPIGIARAPFSPVLSDGMIVRAEAVDLPLHPEALLYVMPSRSGYIGGDLIGFILASEVAEQDEILLGLDLGTNGEIFLGNRDRLLSCSAAAGPALEGARIAYGMIAADGAIEGVRVEGDRLVYRTIGNIKPKGICGSGLIDLIAVLLHVGIIDYEGLIRPLQGSALRDFSQRVVERGGVCDFLVCKAEESYFNRPIYLTQKDVRELQLAKAAIAAGIGTLLGAMGLRVSDIRKVYLAGALGNYVNTYSAVRVGLIPDLDPLAVESLGNAASTGATMVLLSRAYWGRANRLSRFIEHIELSTRADFNEYFIEQMDFPQKNVW
jgi:uncharacterized 2Fe-2S/4Fe-4S cluster protein (DUF4445 family)